MAIRSTVLSLLIFLFSSFFFTPPALAQVANYTTSHNVTYTIDKEGVARTEMKIGITNKTSKFYATSYKLQIGFNDLTNIRATDKEGYITPILKKNDDGYLVELPFNQKVVGIGNTMSFTLSFDTKSIAQKRGGIWEISVPPTAKQETFSDFSITVKPPPEFGTPSVVRPQTDTLPLVFTKEELGKTGIFITFGDKQYYEYTLTYHLKNNNVFPIQTEIALPPSTNYQKTSIESIEPQPVNVLIDQDGNWLAQYRLSPSARREIKVKGKAIVSLTPQKVPLTAEEKSRYTKENTYWTTTPEMKKIAQELKTPHAIYLYVVKKLTYDHAKRTTITKSRVGAKDIFANPTKAVCLEFTDLFIAMARSAGIPAREVDGYAYTDNDAERPLSLVKDILHAWPEYYDTQKGTWVMVDPTWENTTNGMDYFTHFDLNHLTFVIRGNDSSYPVPAGGYKLSENDAKKDVSVAFLPTPIELPQEQLSLTPEFEKSLLSGFPISGSIRITNIGSSLLTEQKIAVTSKTLTPHEQIIVVPPIPPYGTKIVTANFNKTPFLTKAEHTFTMSIQDKKIEEDIFVTPFLLTKWHLIGGILFAILTIGLSLIAIKTGRLPLFRR